MPKPTANEIAAIIHAALEEYARCNDGFDAEAELYDQHPDDDCVDLTYKGVDFRISVAELED